MSNTKLIAIQETHRLSQEAYAQVEKRFPVSGFPKDGIEAAYRAGVNDVLAVLRRDIVIG